MVSGGRVSGPKTESARALHPGGLSTVCPMSADARQGDADHYIGHRAEHGRREAQNESLHRRSPLYAVLRLKPAPVRVGSDAGSPLGQAFGRTVNFPLPKACIRENLRPEVFTHRFGATKA